MATTRELSTLTYYFLSMQALGVYPFLSKAALTFSICHRQRIQNRKMGNRVIINFPLKYTIYHNCPHSMQCIVTSECPGLYDCVQGRCQHQPITEICPQLLICVGLIPLLAALSNRVGICSIWIIYPTLITIMSYQFTESLELITPIALAASFVMLFLSLKGKGDAGADSPVNFYVVNIAIPPMVMGINLGLFLTTVVPFLEIFILAVLALSGFLFLSYHLFKDTEAVEKISGGHFRKMLPSRLQNSKKLSLSIQLALIQEADSEIEQHENEVSPTRKSQIREQLRGSYQNEFPYWQLLVCLVCFVCYSSLAFFLPEFVSLMGVSEEGAKMSISYGILLILVLIGEVYLYKFYVEPNKNAEEYNRINLGVKMDTLKMIRICLIGFFGALMEGLIGFGLSYAMFFYLAKAQTTLKDTIATCGFLTIFISSQYTIASIFSGNFQWLHFLIMFLATLVIMVGAQYLLHRYLETNTKPESLNTTLIVLLTVLLVCNLISVVLGFSFSWVRFGFKSISKAPF